MASSPAQSSTNFTPTLIMVPPVVTISPRSDPVPSLSLFQSLTPLTLKLDRGNYSFWRSQVVPTLRAHDLEGFILGTNVFPP